jgi:hypothetical protein
MSPAKNGRDKKNTGKRRATKNPAKDGGIQKNPAQERQDSKKSRQKAAGFKKIPPE